MAPAAAYSLVSRARTHLSRQPVLEYNDGPSLDVVGNEIKDDKQSFLCTVSPESGDFELLVVQAQDECKGAGVTWGQTSMTTGTPRVFRAAFWHYKGIPMARRWDQKSYRWYDWLSIACRWIPGGVALAAVVSVKAFDSEDFLSTFTTLMQHRLASLRLLQQTSSGIQRSVCLCRGALQVVSLPAPG
jgi:hypothetical protein